MSRARHYSERVRNYLTTYFRTNIPLLTPLAFDPGHPFPVVSNRSKNFAVAVKHNRRTKFARVKVPPILPRFIRLPPADSRWPSDDSGVSAATSRRPPPGRTPGVCTAT